MPLRIALLAALTLLSSGCCGSRITSLEVTIEPPAHCPAGSNGYFVLVPGPVHFIRSSRPKTKPSAANSPNFKLPARQLP